MQNHTHTPEQIGEDRGYTGTVAVEPYTDEDRRAHGNIVRTERCATCGATRRVNINQAYTEVSPWSESETAAVQRAERERLGDGYHARPHVIGQVADRPGTVRVEMPDGTRRTVTLAELHEAAHQDMRQLREVYGALLREAQALLATEG